MSVEVREEEHQTKTEEHEEHEKQGDTKNTAKAMPHNVPAPRPSLSQRIAAIQWEAVEWRLTLLTAVGMAIGWCLLFASPGWVQFLAGIVPVSAGLFLGSRVKNQVLVHGLILGISGFVAGLVFVSIYALLGGMGLVPLPQLVLDPAQPPISSPSQLISFYVSFSMFAMIPFPAFGTVVSYRNEQRRRDLEAQIQSRGGQLERPGTVRTLEDLQGLSLPQFGTYVKNLYSKYGFAYKDYRFLDKDKHLDMIFEYKEETYLFRLSVADKVRSGTVETLVQDMRRKQIPKGIVITSTEFTPDVQKSIKGKAQILLIDGQTLFDMAER